MEAVQALPVGEKRVLAQALMIEVGPKRLADFDGGELRYLAELLEDVYVENVSEAIAEIDRTLPESLELYEVVPAEVRFNSGGRTARVVIEAARWKRFGLYGDWQDSIDQTCARCGAAADHPKIKSHVATIVDQASRVMLEAQLEEFTTDLASESVYAVESDGDIREWRIQSKALAVSAVFDNGHNFAARFDLPWDAARARRAADGASAELHSIHEQCLATVRALRAAPVDVEGIGTIRVTEESLRKTVTSLKRAGRALGQRWDFPD